MESEPLLHVAHTALVAMDCQAGIVSIYAKPQEEYLEMLLRAKEIGTIVLFGIATSGVVLSTLLHAFDADYRIVIIADCCADLDAELQGVLLKRLFPTRAQVMASGEFVKALKST